MFPGVMIRQCVLPGWIPCIEDLRTIADGRREMNGLDIVPLPVRMGMNHDPACRVDGGIDLLPRLEENIRIPKQPVLVRTVDQILIAFEIIFYAEENRKVCAGSCGTCMLVTAAVTLHPVRPRQIPGDTAVSVEDADRVIRYLASIGAGSFSYIDVRIEGKAYWK